MVLRKVYAKEAAGKLMLGKTAGDVLKWQARDLPAAEGLIAGAPCPPWSQMGCRRGRGDKRSDVLFHILSWIFYLAGRGLRFFILENVQGIARRRGGKPSQLVGILRDMRRRLPPTWHTEVVHTNSFCVAQSRPRVYIAGWNGGMPKLVVPTLPRASLASLLARLPSTDPTAVLTEQMQQNLRDWLLRLKPQLADVTKRGTFACFEVDRRPSGSHANCRTDDAVPCLRHSAHPLWITSLGRKKPLVSRLLSVEERCVLQGFSPSMVRPDGISDTQVAQGCGNAMTVPVVGCIIHAVLTALGPQSRKRSTSSDPTSSSTSSSDSSSS